jgi:hypothetical protein
LQSQQSQALNPAGVGPNGPAPAVRCTGRTADRGDIVARVTSLPEDSDSTGSTPGSDTGEAQRIVCALCGTPADGPRPMWTCSVENGTRHYFCDNCARGNLRAIEGRLDSAWW